MQSLEEMTNIHKIEMKEVREALVKNEEQYRKWLDEEKTTHTT